MKLVRMGGESKGHYGIFAWHPLIKTKRRQAHAKKGEICLFSCLILSDMSGYVRHAK